MTETWGRVERLFHAAMDRPPRDRTAFLDKAYEDDLELRAEVESLLAASGEPTGWLDGAVVDEALEVLADELPEGASVGPYRILRPLGRGGMGAVYLAERADGEYDGQVAVKVIKRGMDTNLLLARFRRERQILAQLNHPSIARLLDGGTLMDGRPFLVMEYVVGEPIDHHIGRRRLGIDQRLRIFLKVCEAVSYSHRNLVIHRDIKPSNILVDPGGEPKLLDFGTAKLTLEAVGGSQTGRDQRLLTPAYASPEQIRGEPVSTSSDVFALGVLLYELLSDRHPFRKGGQSYSEIVAAVCDDEPARLSQVAPPERHKALRGDLDAIVARALRKEPEARYGSVADLVQDVERHLESLPVRARRGGFRYRTGRFLKRHRVAAAAAAVVVALSMAFVGALIEEQRQTRWERVRAETVTDYLESLFEGFDPYRGEPQPVTAREMLDRGVERIDEELARQPELKVDILTLLGSIYGNLGYREEALDLVGRALEAHDEQGLGENVERARLAILLADAEIAVGDLAAAAGRLEEVSATLQDLGHGDGLDASRAWLFLGVIYRIGGRYAEAEAVLARAVESLRRLPQDEDHSLDKALLELGAVLRQTGRVEALDLIEEAVEGLRQRRGEKDARTISALEALGAAKYDFGDWQDGRALMEKVLEARTELFGPEHAEVSTTIYNLGVMEAANGRYEQAAQRLDEARRLFLLHFPAEHPQTIFTSMWSARVALDRGLVDKARQEAAATLEAAKVTFSEQHSLTVDCMFLLAEAQRSSGRLEDGQQSLEAAAALLADSAEWEVPRSAYLGRLWLAQVGLEDGDLSAAERWLEASDRFRDDAEPRGLYRRLALEMALALTRQDVATARQTLSTVQPQGSDSLSIPDRLRFDLVAAAVDLASGRAEDAERRAREALDLARGTVGASSLWTGRAELSLALSLLARDRVRDARPHLEQAVELLPEGFDRLLHGPSAREVLAGLSRRGPVAPAQ